MKSAYNRVDRKVLMEIIEKEKILTGDKMNLVRFLLTHNRVIIGEYKCSTSNGVPQGSTISPYLFNISLKSLH